MALDTGFERPTFNERIDEVSDDLNAQLPGEDSRVRFTVPWALARLWAGALYILGGGLSWVNRQYLPDVCDESTLERHANIRGVPRIQAQFASLAAPEGVAFTGTNGTLIPSGSEVFRIEDGLLYNTTADGTIAGGTVTVPLQAQASGDVYNAVAGTLFSLTTPISGVDSEATLTADMLNGSDLEPVDDWRARILDQWRNPLQGGAIADYVAWSKLEEFVDRVQVFPTEFGPGTVGVRFTVKPDPDAPASADIVPTTTQVADVWNRLVSRAPATVAAIHVFSSPTDSPAGVPLAQGVSFDISVSPDNAAVRAEVRAKLDELFLRLSEPGGTIFASQISAAISSASGEDSHTVNSPAGDVVAASADHIPVIIDPLADIVFTP